MKYLVVFDGNRLDRHHQPPVELEAKNSGDFDRKLVKLAQKRLALGRGVDAELVLDAAGIILRGAVYTGAIRLVGRFEAQRVDG